MKTIEESVRVRRGRGVGSEEGEDVGEEEHSYSLPLSSLTTGLTTCSTCGLWLSMARSGPTPTSPPTSPPPPPGWSSIRRGSILTHLEILQEEALLLDLFPA